MLRLIWGYVGVAPGYLGVALGYIEVDLQGILRLIWGYDGITLEVFWGCSESMLGLI